MLDFFSIKKMENGGRYAMKDGPTLVLIWLADNWDSRELK